MLLSAKEAFMPANNRKNPFLLAPISTLAVLVLLLIFSFLEGDGGAKSIVLVLVFTLFSFGIPLILHCFLRGEPLFALFPMRKPTESELFLILSAVFSLIFLETIAKYTLFHLPFDYRNLTVYGFAFAYPSGIGESILAVLAIVLLPAVLEECFFRGAIFHEYRFSGVFMSVLVSSIVSAMTGLSFSAFPFLLLSALFFAWIRVLTGNLISCVLVHALYGIYTLFFEKYLWLMSLSEESEFLFGFLMALLFGLSFLSFLYFASNTLKDRANRGDEAPMTVEKRKMPLMVFYVFTAQPAWILVCFYLITAVFRLFLG